MQNRFYLGFILAALIFASIACNYPMRNRSTDAIQVTTEAVQSLQDDLNTAIEQLKKSGKVRMVIEEEELTSMLALELQKQENPVLVSPQVFLRDGQVRVNGRVNQSGLNADLEVVVEITVTEDGQPSYQVVDATIGSLPLPSSMMDDLSDRIDAAFQNNISPKIANVYIESVTIADGVMVIVGYSTM